MASLRFPFDAQNPIAYSWPIVRTPIQKTIVNESVSGKDYRLSLYPWPKWKWQIDYGYLWDDFQDARNGGNSWMFQQLAGFFNNVQGQDQSWTYMDPFDNATPTSPLPYVLWNYNGIWNTTANGTLKSGQICKQQLGGPFEACQIVLTSSPTPKFYWNGVLQGGGSWSISQPPATVTFNSAPPAGTAVTWSGGFMYLCRFTADSYDFSHDWYGKYTAKKIEFQTVFA